MKLIKLLPNLDYPCTINFNVLNENDEYIPISFRRTINFPIRCNLSDIAYQFSAYFESEVVLFEEITTDREYRIDVY